MLVFAGQANVYVLRERGAFWNSRLAPVMLYASATDLLIVTLLATAGIMMAPLPPAILAMLFVATLIFGVALGIVKRSVFKRVGVD